MKTGILVETRFECLVCGDPSVFHDPYKILFSIVSRVIWNCPFINYLDPSKRNSVLQLQSHNLIALV